MSKIGVFKITKFLKTLIPLYNVSITLKNNELLNDPVDINIIVTLIISKSSTFTYFGIQRIGSAHTLTWRGGNRCVTFMGDVAK